MLLNLINVWTINSVQRKWSPFSKTMLQCLWYGCHFYINLSYKLKLMKLKISCNGNCCIRNSFPSHGYFEVLSMVQPSQLPFMWIKLKEFICRLYMCKDMCLSGYITYSGRVSRESMCWLVKFIPSMEHIFTFYMLRLPGIVTNAFFTLFKFCSK